MTKVYDNATDLITFARGSSATYLDSDGVLKTAVTDTPRIEYDGSDGSLKGLLIEEARTNLVTYSEDFSNAAWGKFDGGVIVPDAATSPDGTSNASQFYGSDNAHVIEDINATAGTTYTYSVFVKTNGTADLTVAINYRAGGSTINYYGVDIDTTTGVVSAPALGAPATASNVQDVGNGWFRLSISQEAPATTTLARVYMANRTGSAASSSDGYLIYGAQLEAGSFATSYIPTAGSTVTRSADIASIPVSAFGYNQGAGTVVVEAQTNNPESSLPHLWQLDANVSNTRIACTFRETSGAVRLFVQNSGSTDASLYRGSPLTETTEVTTAGTWQTDDVAFSYDGSAVAADTNGCAIPLADTLRLGGTNAVGTTSLNGHIKSIQYYPRRLTDAQLQELTS